MDPSYEELALLRAHEPGLTPPTHHLPADERRRRRTRRHLASGLRRMANLVAPALTLCGVFALRYAVVEGGRQSADDPQATFDMTG